MGSQVTRVLHLFPLKYQEKEALQDHWASEDQMGWKGIQGQRVGPEIQVGRNNYAFVEEHLTCHPDILKCPLPAQVLWDLLGRRACLGLMVDRGCLGSVEKWDKWVILVCKAWKVGRKPDLERFVVCSGVRKSIR